MTDKPLLPLPMLDPPRGRSLAQAALEDVRSITGLARHMLEAPASTTATELRLRMAEHRARVDEALIKILLGRWVSGFEPSVVIRRGEIVGLCVDGDPTGYVCVPLFDFRPAAAEIMRRTGVAVGLPKVTTWEPGYDF
jgi:hypothetical protein